MKFWKEKKVEKPVEQKKNPNFDFKTYEREIRDQFLQVKFDIQNINLHLSQISRRLDDFEVCYQNLMERNIDAIEMKDAFLRVLEMAGYTKVRER